MLRNYLVVLAVGLRRYPHVGAALAGGFIAKAPERLHQIRAAYAAWQSYSANTSSRTKWRRTDAGRAIVSSK